MELLARQDAKDVSPWPQKITFDKARYFDQKCHYAFSNIENFSFNLFLIINVTKIFKILKIVTIIVPFLIIFKKMNGLFLQFKQVQWCFSLGQEKLINIFEYFEMFGDTIEQHLEKTMNQNEIHIM